MAGHLLQVVLNSLTNVSQEKGVMRIEKEELQLPLYFR